MPKPEIIYPNIEAERARMGLSVAEFAEKIGITRQTYYSYIRGVNPFTSTTLIKMATITQSSTDYLLGLPSKSA